MSPASNTHQPFLPAALGSCHPHSKFLNQSHTNYSRTPFCFLFPSWVCAPSWWATVEHSAGLGAWRLRLQSEALRRSLCGKSLPLPAPASSLETLSNSPEAPLLAEAVWAAGESKHRSEIPLGANPNSSRSVNTTQAKCSLPPSNRETLGLFVLTDKHIIIVTLASEWGFVVYKMCPLILSLQPSPQPWRSWRVIITSMAKTQGKYYSKSFILSLRDLVMKAQRGLSSLTKLLELEEAEPDMEPWHLAPRLAHAHWVHVLCSPHSLRRRASSVMSRGFPETHTHSRAEFQLNSCSMTRQ